MTDFTPIYLPQSGPNDVTATLVEWTKAAGHWVNAGEVVAVAETTKSVLDIEAPQAGYLHPLVDSGAEAAVGAVIAALSPGAASTAAAQAWLAAQQAAPERAQPRQDGSTKPATKKAELLAQRHGIDLAVIPAPGDRITEADVLAVVSEGRGARGGEETGRGGDRERGRQGEGETGREGDRERGRQGEGETESLP